MTARKNRDSRIDIVKALGIVLMVFYHAGTPGKNFVYLFHMALFFICSGYCYSHKSEDEPLGYIKKKIRTLYVPCLVSGIIVASLHNLFLDIHIYSYEVYSKLDFIGWMKQVLKCLAFAGGHQMIGANWFFRTLFFSSVMYMLLNRILNMIVKNDNKKVVARAVICVILTGIGGYLGVRLAFGKYFNFLTVMLLLDMGLALKEQKILAIFNTTNRKIFGILVGFGILMVLNQFGEISINSNIIINPVYFAVCSASGFLMTYLIADYFNRTPFNKWLKYVGQKSIWIMFFHYVGFKIVTLCEILVLHEPIENLAAYPAHHTKNGMWAIYGISGVLFPLLFVWTGNYVKRIYQSVKQPLKDIIV